MTTSWESFGWGVQRTLKQAAGPPGPDLSLSLGSLSPSWWLRNVLWTLFPEGTRPFDDSLFQDSWCQCLRSDDIQGCVPQPIIWLVTKFQGLSQLAQSAARECGGKITYFSDVIVRIHEAKPCSFPWSLWVRVSKPLKKNPKSSVLRGEIGLLKILGGLLIGMCDLPCVKVTWETSGKS